MARGSNTLGTRTLCQASGAWDARAGGLTGGAEGGAFSGAVSSGGACWGSPGLAASWRISQPRERVLARGTSGICAAPAVGRASTAAQANAAASGRARRVTPPCNRLGQAEVSGDTKLRRVVRGRRRRPLRDDARARHGPGGEIWILG